MDKHSVLDGIFANDPLGLLTSSTRNAGQTSEERLSTTFHEINTFIDKHGREPSSNLTNVFEHQLHNRLKGFRQDLEKVKQLQSLDRHGLFKATASPPPEIRNIEDLINQDISGLLDSSDVSLFDLKHVPKETTMPDYVARRKPCKAFKKFEHLFKNCQNDLSAGIRKLIPFKNEQQINEGCFYVLHGILLYVDSVGKREQVKGKQNARLRCIFENGTESDMMLRSLAAELYKDGRRITANQEELLQGFSDITPQDEATGYIYILKSLSKSPEISNIKDLYKIGYSTTTVEERIQNAVNEPTYLMAKVKLVAAYRCYNMNTQKLETLLHRFFGASCLNIDIFDSQNQRHSPREWFMAPLPVIQKSIDMILDGSIVDHRYNRDTQSIE